MQGIAWSCWDRLRSRVLRSSWCSTTFSYHFGGPSILSYLTLSIPCSTHSVWSAMDVQGFGKSHISGLDDHRMFTWFSGLCQKKAVGPPWLVGMHGQMESQGLYHIPILRAIEMGFVILFTLSANCEESECSPVSTGAYTTHGHETRSCGGRGLEASSCQVRDAYLQWANAFS